VPFLTVGGLSVRRDTRRLFEAGISVKRNIQQLVMKVLSVEVETPCLLEVELSVQDDTRRIAHPSRDTQWQMSMALTTPIEKVDALNLKINQQWP
jgi:hypothetical protein